MFISFVLYRLCIFCPEESSLHPVQIGSLSVRHFLLISVCPSASLSAISLVLFNSFRFLIFFPMSLFIKSVGFLLGFVRFGSVLIGSVRFRSVQHGFVRFNSVHLGLDGFTSASFGLIRFCTVSFGSVQSCSVSFGSLRF